MTECEIENLVKLKKEGKTYVEIGALYGLHPEAVRGRLRRYNDQCQMRAVSSVEPEIEIAGVHPGDELPDEDEVYSRAANEWGRTAALQERKHTQTLTFPYGPVALAFLADQHFGSADSNVVRAFQDAETVANTPGMYAVLLGDVTDNMIIGRLMQYRLGTRTDIPDEFALLRRFLRLILKKTVIVLPGNHPSWIKTLVGIDYFADVLKSICSTCLYDADEVCVTVQIGQALFPGKVRHSWRGRSQYNPTHGQEKADKWPGDYFVWSAGGHTHEGAFTRTFATTLGEQGMAVQAGSYKDADAYARQRGFPKPTVGVPVVVFDEKTRSMTGFTNLDYACTFMHRMYG